LPYTHKGECESKWTAPESTAVPQPGKRKMTIFTCRTCDNACHGFNDGTMDEGWRRIDHIDGPNALCPSCAADPKSLLSFHRSGYPNAALAPSDPPVAPPTGAGPMCACGRPHESHGNDFCWPECDGKYQHNPAEKCGCGEVELRQYEIQRWEAPDRVEHVRRGRGACFIHELPGVPYVVAPTATPPDRETETTNGR